MSSTPPVGAALSPWRRRALGLLERIESSFEFAFGPRGNPMKQLGALGWYCYWVVAVSGLYLFIFYDSGLTEAYDSVEQLTHAQWYAGGIMRSLHRYASDALIVFMLTHLVREYLKGRYRGVRWFAWVTGIVAMAFVYASGITGYWIVWDRLAQYVAVTSSEFLDALGLFGEPIARNFVHASTLSGRFFTLMVFIHIAVPLILLFILWIHTQRLAHARVNPPRSLAIGMTAMLLAASLLRPALSQGPADLGTVPTSIGLDWFYLTIYPLFDRYPLTTVWLVGAGAFAVLLALPWLPPARRRAAARVDLGNCNGCTRCYLDCPYSAITMVPRRDGRPYEQQPVVDPDLCIACGLCAGACPTATPYRRRSDLIPGIELPDQPLAQLREQVLALAADLRGSQRVLVFGCEFGPALSAIRGPEGAAISLPCLGALPPSFIDYLIARRHVDGVMLAGCAPEDCHARLGARWTEARLAGTRDPCLRNRVAGERVATCLAGAGGKRTLMRGLEEFRRRLAAAPPVPVARAAKVSNAVEVLDA